MIRAQESAGGNVLEKGIFMNNTERFNGMMGFSKFWIGVGPVLCLAVLMVAAGCGSSKGSGSKDSGAASTVVTADKGGAVSLKLADGTNVTLEIPKGAIEGEAEIRISATPEGEMESVESSVLKIFRKLTLTVDPAPELLDPAALVIQFPDGASGVSRRVVQYSSAGDRIVKQEKNGNILKATVYRLDRFICEAPDESGMITEAYSVMKQAVTGDWRDAYGTFDALVAYTAFFQENGRVDESRDCLNALVPLCVKSAETFLSTPSETAGSKDVVFSNTLKKFKQLMVLCEAPDEIMDHVDSRILAMDGGK